VEQARSLDTRKGQPYLGGADRAPLAGAFQAPVMSDRIGYPMRDEGGPSLNFNRRIGSPIESPSF